MFLGNWFDHRRLLRQHRSRRNKNPQRVYRDRDPEKQSRPTSIVRLQYDFLCSLSFRSRPRDLFRLANLDVIIVSRYFRRRFRNRSSNSVDVAGRIL